MELITDRQGKATARLLVLLLLLAGAIRLCDWPSWSQVRDVDEVTYLHNGLNLLEGMSPAIKAAPAGVTTWTVWTYAAFVSARNLFFPTAIESELPKQIRPYAAIDRALFDTYRDLRSARMLVLIPTVLISLFGVGAAVVLGHARSGLLGGLLAGGLMALTPLFVEMSCEARPYAIGWSFAIAASACAAACSGRRRLLGSAVFLGLAISSRIDMIAFAPLVCWDFWNRSEPGPLWRTLSRLIATTAGITVLVSPWIATNLIGVVRSIGSARFGAGVNGFDARHAGVEFGWGQGLGPVAVIVLVGLLLAVRLAPLRIGALTVLVVVLLASMTQWTHGGLRYHAAVLLVVVAVAPLALREWLNRWPRAAVLAVILALTLPGAQSVALVAGHHGDYVEDGAVSWLEAHAPAGTTVYLAPGALVVPLPTSASRDRLWMDVMAPSANQKKFGDSLQRFGIGALTVPNALSEDNLSMERGLRRRWFILGERPEIQDTRFDIWLVDDGSAFDLPTKDLEGALARSGGVAVWRGTVRTDLGPCLASWVGADGSGTFIYGTLHNVPAATQ